MLKFLALYTTYQKSNICDDPIYIIMCAAFCNNKKAFCLSLILRELHGFVEVRYMEGKEWPVPDSLGF